MAKRKRGRDDNAQEVRPDMRCAVYAGTPNLYGAMVTAAKSLYANSSVDVIYFLIEDDAFPYEMPDFCRFVNVKGFEDRTFPPGGANSRTHFTKMALVRVCYPELLPEVDNVLQLDVDTLVIDDIDEIWGIDLDGKWFAAAPETYSNYRPFGNVEYFNVGVCYFNVAQMRADDAQYRLVNWINTTKANCVEQDALNLLGAMQGYSTYLPMRFNENRACGYTDNPAIVHYLGYMDWETNPNLPRREYLKRYRDMTWDEAIRLHHG